MSKPANWFLAIVAMLLMAAIGSLGTRAYTVASRAYARVPLTAGLAGEWAAVSAEFDHRVKAAFPVGSDEPSMGAELRRQGFTREDWTSFPDQEHMAMRREDNFVCRQAAYVYWRGDLGGRITAVRGLYREEGCL